MFFHLVLIVELKIVVFVSRKRITSVNLVCDYRFLMIKGEIDATVLKYRWYAQAPYYRAYAHQVDFLQQLKNQLPYKLRGTSEGSET